MMRLDKYLADMGKGTRTEIKKMIRQKRVCVNGETAASPDRKVDPGQDEVFLDGVCVRYVEKEYYMLNKPAGVVSAVTDRSYQTVVDLISGKKRNDLFPVGRLDLDTEGLILITNDGELAHDLLSPRKHVDKTYDVLLEDIVTPAQAACLEKGIVLEDGTRTMPAEVEVIEPRRVLLTLREGKFHQVKRMFACVSNRVIHLKRVSMGSLTMDETLPKGGWRPLTEEEIRGLKERPERKKK